MFEELKPHLKELRKRLLIIVASLLLSFVVAFIFNEQILAWMIEPLQDALKVAKLNTALGEDGKITTHQVGGAFFVALKVAFFGAIIISLPITLSQIWLFIAPGLYDNEKKMVFPFMFFGTIMFLIGASFAYYIVTPYGFEFLISFGSANFIPYINIEDYVGFFSKIMFGFGIAFELPVVILFLALIGLVNDKDLRKFFKYAIVMILALSAMLTPPDILTQMLMAAPLLLLYSISIIIAKIINPYKKKENGK